MSCLPSPTTSADLSFPVAVPSQGRRNAPPGPPRFLLLTAFLIAAQTAVMAQPAPKLASISSEWLQRGRSVDVVFEGENLSSATRLVFAGEGTITGSVGSSGKVDSRLEAPPGLFAGENFNDPKKVSASIVIPNDAPLGDYDVRLVTPAGISNPLLFRVTDLPEMLETDGTNSAASAIPIRLPVGISGRIKEMAQADHYRFKASRGQRLIFDVYSSRAGSPLDPSLALLDSSGRELVRSEDVNVFDPLIDWTAPSDGEYILQIRDYRFQGGGNYKYHIAAGEIPYLDAVFPFGGQRGQPVELSLKGRNLDDASVMKLRVGSKAPAGIQEVRARTAKGFSNPRSFEVSDYPEFIEGSTNLISTNGLLPVPININGHVEAPQQVDAFRFKADKGQRLVFEVMASRFGSELDALLTLKDSTNGVVQRNDDAVGADARIDFTFKESGTYEISVTDLLGRGGPGFGYRLAVRPPAGASLSARATTDALRVHRGGCVIGRVEITRNGFGGPVEISAADLPKGVECPPVLIQPDLTAAIVELRATEDAALETVPVKWMASAVIGGKKVTRKVQPTAADRGVRQAFLTVLEAAPFSLNWVSLSGEVEQNQSATLIVQANRRPGFTGDITLAAEGFSAGRDPLSKSFETSPVTLKSKETRAEFKLKAKLDAETGTRSIYVKGESSQDGQAIVQYSPVIPMTVNEFPFVLANSLPRLTLTALPSGTQSAASEAEFSVKVTRKGLFDEEINLSLEGLPEGIVATSTNLPRGVGEVPFRLSANDKAKAGTTNTVVVVGTSTVNGRTFQQRAPGVTLLINAPVDAPQQAAAK